MSDTPRRTPVHDKQGPSLVHPLVTMIRRGLLALGVAGIVAAILRVRGSGGVPPQSGGWRELSGPDLD